MVPPFQDKLMVAWCCQLAMLMRPRASAWRRGTTTAQVGIIARTSFVTPRTEARDADAAGTSVQGSGGTGVRRQDFWGTDDTASHSLLFFFTLSKNPSG